MTNPLEQSDEDFLNSMPPVVEESAAVEEPSAEEIAAHNEGEEELETEGQMEADPSAQEPVVEVSAETKVEPEAKTEEVAPETKEEPKAPVNKTEEPKADPTGSKEESEAANTVFNVPNKIRANGKDIKIKSEAEALQLMQMGANYTRNMQQIAPHRKLLMMLQDNGLTDETKLSFLIDLDKKNPEAIKKLIQDSGMDPMEIDTTVEPAYLPGSHNVTDQEATFRTAITELASDDAGRATVSEINTKWDPSSKEAVWQNPEIMSVIHEQRKIGVYDLITSEMDRRITLGVIPAGTPFLEAYRIVGDELSREALGQSGGAVNGAQTGQGKPEPVVVATRAANPKATVANGDKASAASPTRTTPASAKPNINFLSMSDEDFLKQMEGRV